MAAKNHFNLLIVDVDSQIDVAPGDYFEKGGELLSIERTNGIERVTRLDD